MNHGRKKQDQVKQDDLKQQEYETFDSEMRLNRINKIHSLKSLASTSNLLSINPDYYTCWNYRREILVELFKSSNPQELCLTELKFTESCLLIHPKSYWVWFHRKWALQQMPDPIYKIEFKLLDGLLNLDNRNFHIWDYRRYLVAQSGFKTDLQEFNHTTEMIYKNFSNHSAWHTRSKILPGLFSGVELEHAIQQDLELVRNAIYTEPSDQSAWLYQRWLLGSGLALEPKKLWKSEYIHVKELNEIEPNWVLWTMVHMILEIQSGNEVDDEYLNEMNVASEILDRLCEIDVNRSGFYFDKKLQIKELIQNSRLQNK